MTASTFKTDPERALVGALLWLPAAECLRLTDQLLPDDLADNNLRLVVRAVRAVASRHGHVDAVTVLAEARTSGAISQGGLAEFGRLLADLATGVDHPLWADIYLEVVIEQAVMRRIEEASTRLRQAARSESTASAVAIVRSEVAVLTEAVNRFTLIDKRRAA